MSSSTTQKPDGHRKLNWMVAGLLCALPGAAGFFFWLDADRSEAVDPLFRGKPESEWIKNLKYSDDEQVKEWRSYGEPGVQVLLRGLEHSNRRGERTYRQLHRRLPGWLARHLPSPKDDATRAMRMDIVALLSSLGDDAKSALPTMNQLLIQDEADSVRQLVINFYNSSEDEKCLLNRLSASEKNPLLPAFIRDAQNTENWGLRNNALISLGFYREQRNAVAPVLLRAIHDPQPQVVLVAGTSLNRVAPELITNAGLVKIVAGILANPDDQIAYRAAELLGRMKAEPPVAVPALITALKSSSQLVANDSASALLAFNEPTNLILPALQEVVEGRQFPDWVKRRAQKKIEGLAPPEKGAH